MIISKKHNKILTLFNIHSLYRGRYNKSNPLLSNNHSAGIIYPFILSFFFVALSACDNNAELISPPNIAKQSKHRVETVNVEQKAISLNQLVSGTLEAVTKIRLYNEESGRLMKLPFHEGDIVSKDSLLAQFDDVLIKIDVAKARAEKKQARVDLSRAKKLLSKKITTDEEVAKAETAYELAKAEENRQLTRLKRTSITSPIDGLITQRFYEPGDLLPQQSHILTIIDPYRLQLTTHLAERWIPLIKQQQDVSLKIDALGDTVFNAKITRIHPTINPKTHNGTIEIELNPVPEGAKEGQFARAEIKLTATDRLVIPVHTIHFEPEGAYVFRIISKTTNDSSSQENLVAEKVYFEQGQQFGTEIEVLSALKSGDKIVSRGYLGLRDGKKVIIANNDNKPAIADKDSSPIQNDGAVSKE